MKAVSFPVLCTSSAALFPRAEERLGISTILIDVISMLYATQITIRIRQFVFFAILVIMLLLLLSTTGSAVVRIAEVIIREFNHQEILPLLHPEAEAEPAAVAVHNFLQLPYKSA